MSVLCLILLLALPAWTFAEDQDASAHPEATNPSQAETQPLGAAEGPAVAGLPPVASKEDIGFSIGYTIGSDMAKRGIDIDSEQLVQGIRAGLGLQEPRLTANQIAQSLFSFQMQMQQQHVAEAQKNLELGRDYLKQNADQEGVIVTDSGLQYKVIESGDGATPTIDDVVEARYSGRLIDGTVFDSSPGDQPVTFPVARVIPGWIEALQMMKVGDKWELTIPADLAYGEAGSPQGNIGPSEVLIFEIELAGIK